MDLFGTIINLEYFLHSDESSINIQTNRGNTEVKVLSPGREYNIPSFQRELRWGNQQLLELIRDLSKNSIFLGNIILKEKRENRYDIIDGQQRITILLMILDYIRSKYEEELDIFEQCSLTIENFPSFQKLRENMYTLDGLTDEQKNEIINSDYYRQLDTYCLIYREITECEFLNNKEKVSSFLQNLKGSVFNVIVSSDTSSNKEMQYFLDVNLKGVQLDNEDIFASYLYSIYSGEDLKQSWRKLKQLNADFNQGFRKKKYEIVDMLQHFLYCDLYLDEKYKDVQFGKDFLLKRNIEIEGAMYYEGTHIIKVINNKTYFKNMLNRLNQNLELLIEIKNNPSGISPKLKDILTKAHVSNVQHNIINSYIATILKDPTMLITNAFIMKYFLELYDADDVNKKNIAESIYSIVMYCNLLSLSKGRKSTELIADIIKEKNMQAKLMVKLKEMTTINWLISNINKTQFSVEEDESYDTQQYKAKALASIYNFFQIKNDKVVIRDGLYSKLTDYLNSNDLFSIEHFLINDSGKYVVKIGDHSFECHYPENIKSLKDDIFNFIFIPKTINESILKNNLLCEKIKLLKTKLTEIQCDYTKMYLEIAEKFFIDFSDSLTENNNVEREINKKFIIDFEIDKYPDFKRDIIAKLTEKINY